MPALFEGWDVWGFVGLDVVLVLVDGLRACSCASG